MSQYQDFRSEMACAAGFFNGEGTTIVSRRTRPSGNITLTPYMSITQCEKQVLERFNRALGDIGRLFGPYGPYSNNQSPFWKLSIGGYERVVAAFMLMLPWLSATKKNQAMSVLNKCIEYRQGIGKW